MGNVQARNFGGKLASVTPEAGVNTMLYGKKALGFYATLNIVNKNKYDVKIRVAIIDSETYDITALAEDDWIEYDTTIRANGGIERSEIAIKDRNSVVVYADTANVNFALWA